MVETAHRENLSQVLGQHPNVANNPNRRSLIRAAVDNKETLSG